MYIRLVPRFFDDCVVMRCALPRHFEHAVFSTAGLPDPVIRLSEARGNQAGSLLKFSPPVILTPAISNTFILDVPDRCDFIPEGSSMIN